MAKHGQNMLVVTDIDGCVTKKIGSNLDLVDADNLKKLINSHGYGMTFCTGRPKPYVEALMQVFDIRLPAICENGGIIFDPKKYRNIYIREDLKKLVPDIKRILREEIISKYRISIEPGKDTTFGLIPNDFTDNETITLVQEHLDFILPKFPCKISHYVSSQVINLMPEGISKKEALQKMCEMIDSDLSQVIGIGDAAGDIGFMELCSHKACPSNSEERVKGIADFVSEKEDILGVIDIVKNFEKVL